MALARAGLAREDDVLAALDEAQGGEIFDERSVELGLEVPVECGQGLADLDSTADDAAFDATLAQAAGRIPEDLFEELQIGGTSLGGGVEVRVEASVEVLQSESDEVASEPFADGLPFWNAGSGGASLGGFRDGSLGGHGVSLAGGVERDQ